MERRRRLRAAPLLAHEEACRLAQGNAGTFPSISEPIGGEEQPQLGISLAL